MPIRCRPATTLASCLLPALVALSPRAGAAQEPLAARNQVALEVGILSAGVSYARRVEAMPISIGVGAWGAWEPANSFDRNLWEPLGLVAFARHWPNRWLQVDLGLTAARYLWADDCSECTGTFVGVRSVALFGRPLLSVGPELSAGRASDDRNGADLGVIWGVQARATFGWDR
jgi:hypothetical protein